MKNYRKELSGGKNTIRVTKYSRREFLKSAAIVATGTAIASISLVSACKSSSSTNAGTTARVNPTTGGPMTSAPASSSTMPSSSLPASSLTQQTSISTTTAIDIPIATGYSYVPPTVLPTLLTVPGGPCVVATDRVYSSDHIWVKSLSANIVVMGITSTMVDILDAPYNLLLSPVGTTLSHGDAFGTIEGYKLTADLISPVSGTIIEANNGLTIPVERGGEITSINNDPYNAGWMAIIQLSKPSELNALMSPQSYRDLVSFLDNKQGGGL